MEYEGEDAVNSYENIEKVVREAITDVTGLTDISKDANLLDQEMEILPTNFLYIFDIIEEKLGLNIGGILEHQTYSVMTIENLVCAIVNLAK